MNDESNGRYEAHGGRQEITRLVIGWMLVHSNLNNKSEKVGGIIGGGAKKCGGQNHLIRKVVATPLSAHVRKAASTNVLLVLYNSAEQHGVSFHEWISFWTNQVSQWFNCPCFVCMESAILNESFDMNDSVSHLLKQGLAAPYWWFYCHTYLSMTDLNQPRCQHKSTFRKILFNYQYWQQFYYFRPQKEKSCK